MPTQLYPVPGELLFTHGIWIFQQNSQNWEKEEQTEDKQLTQVYKKNSEKRGHHLDWIRIVKLRREMC